MKTRILGLALVAFLLGVTLTATTARAAATTTSYPVAVTCTSSGQTCTPWADQSVTLATPALVTLEFATPASHCSDISVQLFVDSVSVGVSAPLPPGTSSGSMSAVLLSAGAHNVSIQATGYFGGCNFGRLYNWGGTLSVTIDPRPVPAATGDCKNGGWETLFDSAGNSFKNQGDCVSYVATKGKNLGAGTP